MTDQEAIQMMARCSTEIKQLRAEIDNLARIVIAVLAVMAMVGWGFI